MQYIWQDGQTGTGSNGQDGDWNNEIRIEWVVYCFNLLKSIWTRQGVHIKEPLSNMS